MENMISRDRLNVLAHYAPTVETYLYDQEDMLKVEQIFLVEKDGNTYQTYACCSTYGNRRFVDSSLLFATAYSSDTIHEIDSGFIIFAPLDDDELELETVYRGFTSWGITHVRTEDGGTLSLRTYLEQLFESGEALP